VNYRLNPKKNVEGLWKVQYQFKIPIVSYEIAVRTKKKSFQNKTMRSRRF
jgi:hypothetical protein